MANIDHIARQDRAIESPESDALDRGPFVASLIKTLVHTDYTSTGGISSRKATGFVVGLTGEWGLGKSSVLNLLGLELKQMDYVAVATLNPWLFKGRDELIEAYFDCLREALGNSIGENTRGLLHQLERYKASIEYVGTTTAGLIDIVIGGGVAITVWDKICLKLVGVLRKPTALSANQERKNLERKIAEEKVAVVVLIDELDRIEDEEVRAVAQLVKAVGDIKGISYLVAYDPGRVAQALGRGNSLEERQMTGEHYLEKIIQFPIPLRPLFEDDSRSLMLSAMRNNGVVLPEDTQSYQVEIFNVLLRGVRTPREIKRLIGAYSVLEEIVRGEICPFDVLAYCWIVTKAPGLHSKIADNIQALVSDPRTAELLRQQRWRRDNSSRSETLVDVLGSVSENYLDILRLLFPRFGDAQQRSEDMSDGHRIAKRRNLTRLLYLGNPPTQFSRAEVERLWSITNFDVSFVELAAVKSSERLGALLDRVGDLASILPHQNGQVFWTALSKLMVRNYDWCTREEVERGFVDDIGSVLFGYCKNAKGGEAIFRCIVEDLINAGDLLIVPLILRRQLFAHGMTTNSIRSGGNKIYDFDETLALRDRELPRYRTAVMEGKALRRLPDTEMIFCMLNCDYWDEGLRSNFTSQLVSKEAIFSLAALIVPQGIMCEFNTLDRLFDAKIVLERAQSLVREEGMPEDEWLATSVLRLIKSLSGQNLLDVGS